MDSQSASTSTNDKPHGDMRMQLDCLLKAPPAAAFALCIFAYSSTLAFRLRLLNGHARECAPISSGPASAAAASADHPPRKLARLVFAGLCGLPPHQTPACFLAPPLDLGRCTASCHSKFQTARPECFSIPRIHTGIRAIRIRPGHGPGPYQQRLPLRQATSVRPCVPRHP